MYISRNNNMNIAAYIFKPICKSNVSSCPRSHLVSFADKNEGAARHPPQKKKKTRPATTTTRTVQQRKSKKQ